MQMTEWNVITGERIWDLNKEQQDIVLVTLGTLGVESFPVSTNQLVECQAVEVLMQAGYVVKSPLQLDEAKSLAEREPMPSAQEATQVPPDHEDVGKLTKRIKELEADKYDLELEVGDLKAAVSPVPGAPGPVPDFGVTPKPTVWLCPRCQTVNPIEQDQCTKEGCTKIRIGSPSSPSVSPDVDRGHPLNPGGA